MFRVEYGENGRSFRVLDDDRGVTFEELGSLDLDGHEAFVMIWGRRRIPLQRWPAAPAHQLTTTGRRLYVWSLGGFNDPIRPGGFRFYRGAEIPSYAFANKQEEERAYALAVEGLLVHTFRQGYRPWVDDKGGIMAAHGKVWLLSDFGYPVQPYGRPDSKNQPSGRFPRLRRIVTSVFRFDGQRKREPGALVFRFDPARYGHEGVVDEERGVTLRGAGGIAYETESAAVLTWGDREIPFNVDYRNPVHPRTGREYTQCWFVSFGASFEARTRCGVGKYEFRDAEEKAQALMLAIEAILVAHFKHRSTPWDASKCAVLVGDREWRLSDFPGYPIAKGAS